MSAIGFNSGTYPDRFRQLIYWRDHGVLEPEGVVNFRLTDIAFYLKRTSDNEGYVRVKLKWARDLFMVKYDDLKKELDA